LLVFVNGSKQVLGTNFAETSSTVVTFVDGLNVGDVVNFCTATPINTIPFIAPNATTTQKNAITNAAIGQILFDTTLQKLCVYTSTGWQTVTSA
jgi:hypothetical protein